MAGVPGSAGSPGSKQAALEEIAVRARSAGLSGEFYSPVRKLLATDQTDAFDCGQAALNQFLQRLALVNQKANSAQTYVCCKDGIVIGLYSLAAGSVDPQTTPSRVK